MSNLIYDDKGLQELYAMLSPKSRKKVFKSALRKEANKVRKMAVKNLRASVKSNTGLERGIRANVHKNAPGFYVTIASISGKRKNGTRIEKGFHKNRFGSVKPVLRWLETGVPTRKTAGRSNSKRSAHNTGSLKRYGFMEKTKSEVSGDITSDLHDELREALVKEAKKYGCK